jgi:hypothetical protein
MGQFTMQGIVSIKTGEPLVQVRQLDDDGNEQYGFQISTTEAREIAQNFLEASMNAVYDAALIAWAKETFPEHEQFGPRMVSAIREFRADKWGLPDQPKDWSKEE